MTIRLNISSREFDPQVNYVSFNTKSRSFIERNVEEAILRRNQQLNKWKVFVSTLGLSTIPTITSAEEIPGQLTTDSLNPQAMFDFSLKIALVGLGASVGITILLIMAASVVKQLGGERNRKKSKDWNTDIIKGFVQCLVAIPTVFALYYLATTIFGQLDFSKNTFLNLP